MILVVVYGVFASQTQTRAWLSRRWRGEPPDWWFRSDYPPRPPRPDNDRGRRHRRTRHDERDRRHGRDSPDQKYVIGPRPRPNGGGKVYEPTQREEYVWVQKRSRKRSQGRSPRPVLHVSDENVRQDQRVDYELEQEVLHHAQPEAAFVE